MVSVPWPTRAVFQAFTSSSKVPPFEGVEPACQETWRPERFCWVATKTAPAAMLVAFATRSAAWSPLAR
jgi:hypothetical protein